jgi:hypothetical protein
VNGLGNHSEERNTLAQDHRYPRHREFSEAANRRSIVASAIFNSSAAVSSSTSNSPTRRNRAPETPTRGALRRPQEPQRCDHRLPIDRGTWRSRFHVLQYQRLRLLLPGVTAMPGVQLVDLVQDLPLTSLVPAPILQRELLRGSLAFSHRQYHTPRPTDADPQHPAGTLPRAHSQVILRYPLRAHFL